MPRDPQVIFPRGSKGFWADAKSAGHYIRLFSYATSIGEVAAVFDMNLRTWITKEWADNLEDGKRKAEAIAEEILKPLPLIEWEKSA